MVPLEVIGLLGLLYAFFVIGTVKAVRAKDAARREAEFRTRRKAAVKPTVKGRVADAWRMVRSCVWQLVPHL